MPESQDKGRDNSPIVLTIQPGTEYFAFCYRTVHLYDAMFHTPPNSVFRSSAHFLKKLNTVAFSGLLRHFTVSSESNQSSIALSLNEIGVLLSMSASINGILLSEEEEELLSLAEKTFTDIPKDWEKNYRKQTDTFISSFKNKYKNLPKLIALLNKLFNNH